MKLSKAERKAFRSQMWAFRRDPTSLTAEEQQALECLFEKIPALWELYRVRLRFQEICDTAPNRPTAAWWLRRLRDETERLASISTDGFFILQTTIVHPESACFQGFPLN